MLSPQPSPTGEGAGCSRFHGCRRFERQLGFAGVDCRSSEKQKAICTPVFLAEPLIPTAAPSSLPVGESLERGQQAARLVFGQLGVGKDYRNLESALSPTLPHGGGSGLQQIQVLQIV